MDWGLVVICGTSPSLEFVDYGLCYPNSALAAANSRAPVPELNITSVRGTALGATVEDNANLRNLLCKVTSKIVGRWPEMYFPV